MDQLNEAGMSAAQKKAGEYIIGNVDENGWLAADVAEDAREAAGTPDDVLAALAIVQEFDPPGVAARSLPGMLVATTTPHRPSPDSLPGQLVVSHLAELRTQSAAELAKAGGWAEADTAAAMQTVLALDPKPGVKFSAPPPVYVYPGGGNSPYARRRVRGGYVA